MATTSHTAVVTLPADNQIAIRREFDAPRHLVWRAMTTPELVKQWWAGERGEVTSVEIDLRVGGRWRYAMKANGGFDVVFYGEYHEIVPPERVVNTEIFEPFPDNPAMVTVVLVEEAGRTTMTVLVEHDTPEARDMHLNSGMEGGMQEAYDRLEQVARSLV